MGKEDTDKYIKKTIDVVCKAATKLKKHVWERKCKERE